MTTMPIAEARNHLSELVDSVQKTHDRVTLTRHGQPAAVLISADDLDSILETLDILSTPGALEDIQEGLAEFDAQKRWEEMSARVLEQHGRLDAAETVAGA